MTATLNARLLPIIAELLVHVRAVMAQRGIHAPLMVVRGDGTLMSEAMTRRRPVETILSGPAASVCGAQALSGVRDGLVLDIGGTTSDIALLIDGTPHHRPRRRTCRRVVDGCARRGYRHGGAGWRQRRHADPGAAAGTGPAPRRAAGHAGGGASRDRRRTAPSLADARAALAAGATRRMFPAAAPSRRHGARGERVTHAGRAGRGRPAVARSTGAAHGGRGSVAGAGGQPGDPRIHPALHAHPHGYFA